MDFPDLLRAALTSKPDNWGADVRGTRYTWRQLVEIGDALDAALVAAGVPRAAPVGIVARNRPFLAAAILGLVTHRRPVTMIYSAQSPEAMAGDIAKLRLAAIVADPQDWGGPQVAAARECGTLGLAATGDLAEPMRPVEGIATLGPGPHREPPAEPGIELLTSGTTGAPKRVMIGFPILERTAQSFMLGEPPPGGRPPQIVSAPFGNVSGLCQLIGCAAGTTPMAISTVSASISSLRPSFTRSSLTEFLPTRKFPQVVPVRIATPCFSNDRCNVRDTSSSSVGRIWACISTRVTRTPTV